MQTDHHMTGAELQTLREACNLSRDELATLAGVAARTVKHWESGRAAVPADVADLVQRLDAIIEQAAINALLVLHDAQTSIPGATPAADVVLIRYRTAEDLQRYRPDMQATPAGAHGAIVQRVAAQLRRLGQHARIVWMMPTLYESWRTHNGQPDTETTRAQWAADQVQHQARPHRTDQPPA